MTAPTALYDQSPVGAVVCANASLARPRVNRKPLGGKPLSPRVAKIFIQEKIHFPTEENRNPSVGIEEFLRWN